MPTNKEKNEGGTRRVLARLVEHLTNYVDVVVEVPALMDDDEVDSHLDSIYEATKDDTTLDWDTADAAPGGHGVVIPAETVPAARPSDFRLTAAGRVKRFRRRRADA